MKKNFLLTITIFCLIFIFISGCEIGTNPLILDSSISSSIRVDTVKLNFEIPLPPIIVNTKSLQDVAGDDIEKINFYNLTLRVDNKIKPTDGKVSARLFVNDTLLVKIDNLLLSLFYQERSIFEKIPGLEVNNTGLGIVLRAVKNPPQNGVKLQMFVGPTDTQVDFDLWIKVYGQIQTKAK